MNKMSAFMPGQLNALANQLQAGFGGGVKGWKGDLREPYGPTPVFMLGKGGGGGNGNGGGNGPKHTDPMPPFDPSRPRNIQPPQMGLLSAQMPMQQQQMGLLGDIPPEVLAFISGNVRR